MTTSLEDAVRVMTDEWKAAWNTHDMSRMSRLLTRDADFVNVLGKHWKGADNIRAVHAAMHETQFHASVWENDGFAVQLLQPNIALVHFRWSIEGDFDPDGTARRPRSGLFSWLIVESHGTWLIRAAHNTTLIALPPAPARQ
ncbi:MAG: SgcJ/EcaC family oxidoreductase [Rubrivivax sp.]